MMPIRRLPPLLVNQIAAGEVIERPASVVKELVENAIDAGARSVDVAIEQGGKELIRVCDDGRGIDAEELGLAVAPHATSKITVAEDLNAIATMGFRGEALASIASVSRLSILSRTAAAAAASIIEAEGDATRDVRPAAGPPGTTVTVRNLFFNTPARRKFLKTEQTETLRVEDVIEAVALAHPDIAFRLTSDGRERLELPWRQSPVQRVLAILGKDLEPHLLEVMLDEADLRIWGQAGKPEIARGTAKHMRLYLNGRPITDRSLQHAIKEAYRGLIDPTRSPTIVLFLTIDPAQVDVNVHPTKAEVRFRNQARVHGAVLTAVRQALRRADLVPSLNLAAAPNVQSWSGALRDAGADASSMLRLPESFGAGSVGNVDESSLPPARAFVDYFRRLDPVQRGFVYSEVKQALAKDDPALLREQLAGGETRASSPEPEVLPVVRPVAEVMQVHSSYIVTQDQHGLVIIDQHALHERVIFERLKARIQGGPGEPRKLESQRLLLPAVVEVERSHVQVLEELKPLLEKLGIEVEPIGPSTIAVHGFTSLLFERDVDPVEFMHELLDKAANRGIDTSEEAALHQVLDMMACKAAVKAGDRLAPEELAELLRSRESIERSSNCPHGRPTSLRLSIKELEKQFGRT